MKKYICSLALIALILTSCGGNEFKVSGNIEGATGATRLVLETSSNGQWLIVDSVKPTEGGAISITEPAAEYANIYRLRFGEKSIYFPIDSIDHIVIKGNVKAFDTDYVLSGSDNAVAVMNIDKKAQQLSQLSGDRFTSALAAWKKQLTQQILADAKGIVAYYIINKYIGDAPIYDPADHDDLRIIGAVANAFNTFKPNDPRTAYLVNVVLSGRKNRTAAVPTDTMYVTEVPLLDISLQDKDGKNLSLRNVASKGNVVLLNFTIYSAEFSPVFNKLLADSYRKHQSEGLAIYQIGYDDEEFQWRQSAKNLPWLTVYDPAGVQSRNLSAYNVTQLPSTFIINRKGEIVEKVVDITQLESLLSKYM